jgi:hypothetical protein
MPNTETKTSRRKAGAASAGSSLTANQIISSITLLRGQRVMLDADLATLYGVTTGNLNKAVQRNKSRFPMDFMFQLSKSEHADLKFQSGISSVHGGRRTPPFAFTQEGVAMLSGVLNSNQAVRVNVAIMRAFVRMKNSLSARSELISKIVLLENKVDGHDDEIRTIFKVLKHLVETPEPPKRRIGFKGETP